MSDASMSDTGLGGAVEPAAPVADAQAPTRRAWLGLAVILLAAFMELLDVTVVTVASPEIQSSLQASYAQVQWILAGYQLTFAAGLVAGGRLGDIFGCRRMFVWGVLLFSGASVLCAVAANGTQIVLFRLLQGLAAALMFPQVLSIIHVTFTGKHRAAAFGALGGTTGLAGIAGPLIGGVLIHYNLFGTDWRSVFLINIPIGLVAAIGASMLVTEWKSEQRPRLDLWGTALGTAAVALVIFPLVQGRDAHWAWWIWTLLGLSVPVLFLFWLHQRGLERRGGSPVVDLSLFRGGAFGTGLLVEFVCFAGVSAFFLVLAVTLQAGYAWSPLRTGAAFLPIALGTGMASGIAIPLLPRLGKRVLQIGAAVMAGGMATLMFTLHAHPHDLSLWTLAPAGLLIGLGLGMIVTTVNDVVLAEAGGPSAGSAAGVQTTVGQAGNAVGVAVLGAIFFGLLSGNATAAARHSVPEFRQELARASVPAAAAQTLELSMVTCFSDQASANDPAKLQPSCQALMTQAKQTGSPAAVKAVGDTLNSTRQQHFSDSMRTGLFYEVAVLALVFVLVFLLPLRRGLQAGAAH
ncbi:MFS transporter [Actinacidiphila acididurans]|uniref:MFS transporter n=1 Tax=Actinacidiphila acididurans TaxID=2784346 RepID=A0ABS2TXV4_9ACTN|nr:MFS transporter [Actinacidiphila acididurans]MBM9508187.1 MFS transporter [Actinacidiphila acididurans]